MSVSRVFQRQCCASDGMEWGAKEGVNEWNAGTQFMRKRCSTRGGGMVHLCPISCQLDITNAIYGR